MEEFNKILIVDDNKDIHDDFQKILSPSKADPRISELEKALFDKPVDDNSESEEFECELYHAYQGDEAILEVKEAEKAAKPFVLIFMDVRMPPGMNGIETIYRIWRQNPLIEMVICTAYSDFSWNEIIKKLGQTDKLLFLKKPFNSLEVKQMTLSLTKKWNLNHKVNLLIDNLEEEVKERTKQLDNLLKELRNKNQKLQEVAMRDSLTGLLNHGALYAKLNAIVSESRRHEYSMSLIMMDIDFFKAINDKYGHLTGDLVIKTVADTLKKTLRLYDIPLRCTVNESEKLKKEFEQFNLIGRYGGDEFILIIPYCDEVGAVSLAERIHSSISDIKLPEYPALEIGSSIGVCILDKNVHCKDSNELIKFADQALYTSKENGRNRISYLKYE